MSLVEARFYICSSRLLVNAPAMPEPNKRNLSIHPTLGSDMAVQWFCEHLRLRLHWMSGELSVCPDNTRALLPKLHD